MRVTWDGDTRPYSQGVKQGVLYPQNSPGVAWNGLISVTEKGDDDSSPLYFDGQIYRNRNVPSDYSGTISAFTYPDEFEPYNGNSSGVTGQPRSTFGFCYKTNNELHIVYNALAAPSSDDYNTLGDTVDPLAFSWSFTTVPEDISMGRASAHLTIMLDYAVSGAVSDLENLLYGTDDSSPSLPDPETIIGIFESYTTLRITDNGDGTWTATGPDDVITTLSPTEFQIDWPSIIIVDSDTYKIYSL